MITKIYRLQCDNCSNEISEDEADSTKEAKLIAASERGMTMRRVPNGAKWMLCRTCSKLKTSELR